MKFNFTFQSRIRKIEDRIGAEGLDALFVSKAPNVTYLSGFRGRDACLLITKKTNFLLTDFRYQEQAKREVKVAFKVLECPSWLGLSKKVGQLAQEYSLRKIGFESEHLSFLEHQKLATYVGKGRLNPTFKIIEELRSIKTKDEIVLIKQALRIAIATFKHLLVLIKDNLTERDLAREADYFMRQKGAEGFAFETIVASGRNAAFPHARPTEKKLTLNEMVLIDLGVVYQGYTCDLTRTVFLGKINRTFSKLYSCVLKAQERAIRALKPNVLAKEVDQVARSYLRARGLEKYFGHSLGHSFGLEVHEDPRLSPSDETLLQPGMVFTVEPAIYIPGWGGIRIEDDILITEKGCNCLSEHLDK